MVNKPFRLEGISPGSQGQASQAAAGRLPGRKYIYIAGARYTSTMDRTRLLLAGAAGALIVVLLAALAVSYMSMSSQSDQLASYQQQQRQMARAIVLEHMADMQTAVSFWTSTHPDDYRTLQDEGITVEADYIDTPYYSAVLDPADPYYVSVGPTGEAKPGEVIVGLGQYFAGNLTKAGSWSASYKINSSTGEVEGFTASLAQSIAYDYYTSEIAPGIESRLGIAPGVVQGTSAVTLDTSYMPETGTWLDVTEYRYSLRNTNQPEYLKITTYINGSSGQVTGADFSLPYYTTESPIMH